MLLCDIGNSRVKFYKGGVTQSMPVAEFMRYEPKERIFFISVNDSVKKKLKNRHVFGKNHLFLIFPLDFSG